MWGFSFPAREVGTPGWENSPSKHQATRGDPRFQEGQEPREEEERIDPHLATELQPHHHPAPWLPHSPEPLKALFSRSHHPPTAGWFRSRSGHAEGWWGPRHEATASPAPWARCLTPLLAQSRRKREFCPFRQSFSASLRRRAHSLSKSECGCGAGPARQTYSVRGEEGRTQPRTLWELVLETWAPGDVARATLVLGGRARSSRLHCPGQEWSRKGAQASLHHCHQGKPSSVTEPDTIRILPKASLSFALQPDQE